MSGRAGRLPVAVALAVVGGLLVVGGTSADWVTAEHVREVGGVAVPTVDRTAGIDLAPRAAPAGLLAVVLGLVLLVAPRRARRVLAAVVVLTGGGALGLVVAGLAGAAARPGDLTAAPGVAAAGAAAVVVAGVLGLLRARRAPALGPRYSVEGAPAADDEWGLASDE